MNIFEYVKKFGQLSFKESALNEVDALILSKIIYIDLFPFISKGKDLESIINDYLKVNPKKHLGVLLPDKIVLLASMMTKTKRYSSLKVSSFAHKVSTKNEEQFSALSLIINDNEIFIAYEGTDDSLIGWYEDLNTIITYPVKAQKDALTFFNEEIKKHPDKKFYLSGHSKGGNLALYAASNLDKIYIPSIKKVFSFDGQGFTFGADYKDGFNRIKNKYTLYSSSEGLVGRLLEVPECHTKIISSTSTGILAHNGLTWEVEDNHFVYKKAFSPNSDNASKGLNDLTKSLTKEQRTGLCLEFYNFIAKCNQQTLTELLKLNPLTVTKDLYESFSGPNKILFLNIIRILIINDMIIDHHLRIRNAFIDLLRNNQNKNK